MKTTVEEIIKFKKEKRAAKAAKKEAITAKCFNGFLETGRVDSFCKYLLSDDCQRRGMIVQVTLIDQDGVEMKYDSRDSKKLKKYMDKFK